MKRDLEDRFHRRNVSRNDQKLCLSNCYGKALVDFPAAMYAQNVTTQTPPGTWDEVECERQRISAFPS